MDGTHLSMKARHGETPIPIPSIQNSPAGIGRLSRETRKAIAALRDRRIIVSGGGGKSGRKLPLDIAGLREEGGAFFVTITPGFVIERTVINDTGTDCLTYHEVDVSTEQEVGDGDAVFVKVTVEDDGAISAAALTADVNDKASTHYAPPVGDETAGSVGEYYYKLAEFAASGDTLAIDRFMAGANIEHFQELPRFVKAGGTADVFKTFDQAAGKYRTRGITGIDGIAVTQGADQIEVGLDGGVWGEFTWIFTSATGGSDSFITLEFEAGRLIGALGTSLTGAGTEASPYVGTFQATDTDT